MVSTIPKHLVSTRVLSAQNDKEHKKRILKRKLQNKLHKNKVSKVFKVNDSLARKQFDTPKQNLDKLNKYFQNKTFDNQRKFGMDIAQEFKSNKHIISAVAIAPTQSGKTGSMLAMVHSFMQFDETKLPLSNVFVCTAHSDKDWVTQTRARFPEEMRNNIFHRNNFKKYYDVIAKVENALIIIDEVQIGNMMSQSIYKLFVKTGLFNIAKNLKRNIKLVSFTATPKSVVDDFASWGHHSKVFYMDVPKSYISHAKLLNDKRILPAKDLCGYNAETGAIDEKVFENIRNIQQYMGDEPKVHVIRTPRGKLHDIVIDNFKKVFNESGYNFFSEPTLSPKIKILETKPDVHTFLFIKDKLRCAKTICKDHLGIMYERYVTKFSVETVVQGLAGRLTGYHENTNSVVFTSVPAIAIYNKQYNEKFKGEFKLKSCFAIA